MTKKFTFAEVEKCFHGNEPWFNVFFLKWLTLPFTLFLANRTRVKPDTVTIFSLFFGLLSSVFFFHNNIVYGVGLYLISYILDAVDGKLARLTNNLTVYGGWLDIFVDRVVFAAIAISLGASQLEGTVGLFITSGLIFTFMFGFESRYNIQADYVRQAVKSQDLLLLTDWNPARAAVSSEKPSTKYRAWTSKKGLINSPLSLVEMLVLLFVVAPLLRMYFVIACGVLLVFTLRILSQQMYWIKK